LGKGVFSALALAAGGFPAGSRSLRYLRLSPMSTMMNAALLVGFYRWLRSDQSAAWKRTARSAEAETWTAATPVTADTWIAPTSVPVPVDDHAVHHEAATGFSVAPSPAKR